MKKFLLSIVLAGLLVSTASTPAEARVLTPAYTRNVVELAYCKAVIDVPDLKGYNATARVVLVEGLCALEVLMNGATRRSPTYVVFHGRWGKAETPKGRGAFGPLGILAGVKYPLRVLALQAPGCGVERKKIDGLVTLVCTESPSWSWNPYSSMWEDGSRSLRELAEIVDWLAPKVQAIAAQQPTIVGGCSLGGMVTLDLARRYPDQNVAFYASFCGRPSLEPAVDVALARPILFLHGGKDEVVPLQYSYAEYLRLKDLGWLVTYILDEDAGHEISQLMAAAFLAAMEKVFGPQIAD